ncbi:MAG: hypothetical protein IKU29_07725 [Parabacteroides sp.]|nr:hypothetical protein [Parabacteroides sp.]
MKLRNIFYTLLAGVGLLTSCDNGCPTFDDKNACVGFSKLSYSIGEAEVTSLFRFIWLLLPVFPVRLP